MGGQPLGGRKPTPTRGRCGSECSCRPGGRTGEVEGQTSADGGACGGECGTSGRPAERRARETDEQAGHQEWALEETRTRLQETVEELRVERRESTAVRNTLAAVGGAGRGASEAGGRATYQELRSRTTEDGIGTRTLPLDGRDHKEVGGAGVPPARSIR